MQLLRMLSRTSNSVHSTFFYVLYTNRKKLSTIYSHDLGVFTSLAGGRGPVPLWRLFPAGGGGGGGVGSCSCRVM